MNSLKNAIGALLRSRIVGFALVMVATFAILTVGIQLWPSVSMSIARRLTHTEPLITPKTDTLEPGVREHMAAVRQRTDTIVRDMTVQDRLKGLAYGELGKVYLAYDFPEAAVPCLRNAAKLDPTEFRWPYLLAEALERASKTEESLRPMAVAVKLMEKDVTANAVDHLAALCFLGQAAMRLNKPAEANQTFQAVLKLAPGNLFALLKSGQLASQSGDGTAALGFLERALKQAPNQLVIRQLLANEYRRQGNTAKAAEFAVSLPSGSRGLPSVEFPDPLAQQIETLNLSGTRQNRLGLRQAKLGRDGDALPYFVRAVAADPKSVNFLLNLGTTLLALGRVEDAQKRLEEARRMDPASGNVRSALCLAWAARPATSQKAIDEVMAWRKEQPDSIDALSTQAQVSMRLERYGDALNAYREAARIAPSEAWPLQGTARALSALGRYPAALAEYEELQKVNPDDADNATELARFLATCPDAKVRNGARSVALAQPLLASDYSVVRAETVALGLAQTGRLDQAMDLQKKAVEYCRDQPAVAACMRTVAVLRSLEARQPWLEKLPFQREKP
jgi:tetratricopeptide (TPR) repeat protein